MPLLGWLDTIVFNGWWIVFWFILFAGCIFISAKLLTSCLEALTVKTRISKIFMGGIVMSLVTSFPELISTIYGAIDDNPLFSIYNETGSNTIQIFILSLTILIFFTIQFSKRKHLKPKQIGEIYRQCFTNITKENKVLIILIFSFYILFCFFVLVPQIGTYLYIPGWNISVISIVPFVMWLSFLIWTLCKKNVNQEQTPVEKNIFSRFNKWILWLFFLIFSVLLMWFAYVNSGVVDKMSDIFNIPTQSAASILLSIPSALPETLTMIFLFRKRQYELGFSALVGSGLTNSSFMFYADSIYRKPIFKEFFTNYLIKDDPNRINAARMQYWIPLVLLIYLFLYITSIKKISKSNKIVTINLSIISLLYVVGVSLISSLVF